MKHTLFLAIKRLYLACAILFSTVASSNAVSVLSAGDIAVVGYNADTPEDFSFVPLVDIDGGVSFNFHENSRFGTYTTPAGGLPRGTVVVILEPKLATRSASIGTISLAEWGWGNGDILYLEQNGTDIYVGETTSGYSIPAGLSTEAHTAVSHPDNSDSGYYTGLRTGTRSAILEAIATPANWVYADTGGDDFVNLNTPPRNNAFTVQDDPPPDPVTGSVSGVYEGWRFRAISPFINGEILGSRLPSIRANNNDALTSDCYAISHLGTIADKGWFSVYFTNQIPENSDISSAKLHIQHQGAASASGTFKLHASVDRTATRWYQGIRTSTGIEVNDYSWNDSEQETVIDLTAVFDTVGKITNAEFNVVNSAASTGDLYFDYMKFVIEFAENNPPGVSNTPATDITSVSATLNGTVTQPTPTPDVTLYWGDNDGGETAGNWDTAVPLGARGFGPFSRGITGLLPDTTYYYRAFGSNTLGTAWAPETSSFTTAAPEISFSAANATVDESAGTVSYTVALSGASVAPASVTVDASGGNASNGADYTFTSTLATITAGALSTTLMFTVSQDLIDEFDETIVLSLSGSSGATIGAPATHTVTISDDDAPPAIEFLVSPSNTVEGAGTATIAALLSARSEKPISVEFTTADDEALQASDYTAAAGRLSWPAGAFITNTVSVALTPDTEPEPSEILLIQLFDATNATIGASAPGRIAIIDDDTGPPIHNNTAGPSSVSSNAATLRGTLDSNGGSTTTAWLYWGTTDGDTTPGNWDDVAIVTNVPRGDYTAVIQNLQITTPYFYRALASNDLGAVWASTTASFVTGPPRVGFASAASASSESNTLVTVSITIDSPSAYAHPVTVNYAALSGTATLNTDYSLPASSVTLAPGQTSTNIYIQVTNDPINEEDETIGILLTQFVNARPGDTTNFVHTINDDDPLPQISFAQTAVSVSEAAGIADLQVGINVAAGRTVSVNYTTLDGTAKKDDDYLTRSGVLQWLAGENDTKSILVPILDDDDSTGNRFFQVSLTSPSGATISGGSLADVTIEEDDTSLPEVSNGNGATGIRSRIAVLNGEVIKGVPPPSASIYWGTTDGGTNAAAWGNTVALGAQDGTFNTEISSLSSGTVYYYRSFVQNASGSNWAPATAPFATTTAQDYFINDGSTAGDVYSDAVGNDANSGRLPGAPKLNISAILSSYDIEPGDTIWIDTGNYDLGATVEFTGQDLGGANGTVLVRGTTHWFGSDFTVTSFGADGFEVDVAGDAYLRFENVRVEEARYGFYAHGTAQTKCRSVEIVNCRAIDSFFGSGIYFKDCRDLRIEGCTVLASDFENIGIELCNDIVVISNICAESSFGQGILGRQAFQPTLEHNICYDNDTEGIRLESGGNETLRFNRTYSNKFHGIYIDGTFCELEGNASFDNDDDGLNITGAGLVLTHNVVHGNGGYGLNTPAADGLTAHNNLFHHNTDYNVYLSANDSQAHFAYNTLYGGKGLHAKHPAAMTNQHNIIWTTGSGNTGIRVDTLPNFGGGEDMVSVYNNLFASDGANVGNWAGTVCVTFDNWKTVTWKDGNSQGADAQFVSTVYPYDFHVQSKSGSWHDGLWQNDALTSPCIDAADPSADYTKESAFHGFRANLGAYGNTAEATRTDYGGPLYALSLGISHANAGSVSVTPVSSVFPTNFPITISSTLTNTSYRWQGWSTDVGSTNTVVGLTLTNDVVAQAIYVALFSNTNGVPDSWLVGHGLPADQESANRDDDSDGHLNWQEFYAGTNPTNAQSVLYFSQLDPTNTDRIALQVETVLGMQYRVRGVSGLSSGSWSLEPVSTTLGGVLSTAPVDGTGSALVLYVANPDVTRVYRVETSP